MQTPLVSNQRGMILVLAMFMLTLLSMIGVASMMTTTTDIEIATGERQHVESFYRAQSAHTIAGELLQITRYDRELLAGDTIDPDGEHVDFNDIDDYAFAFRVIDQDFRQEDEDSKDKFSEVNGWLTVWQPDEQEVDELPTCPPSMSTADCKAFDESIGTQDLELWTDVRLIGIQDDQEVVLADIDIDKLYSHYLAGGGAEFGSKDLGIGSMQTKTMYNIDARARLETGDFNRSPSRQALGFRVVN
jgi:hypothetical protein